VFNFRRPSSVPLGGRSRHLWAPAIGSPGFFIALSDSSGMWEVGVHWIASRRTSVPCTGGDCPFCVEELPYSDKVYLPGLLYGGYMQTYAGDFTLPQSALTYDPRLWTQRTIEIAPSARSVLDGLQRGAIVLLRRPGGRSGNRVFGQVLRQRVQVPDDLGFDVRPQCLTAWGLNNRSQGGDVAG